MTSHTPSGRPPPSKPGPDVSQLHAAMMEELGAARKDRLPLEDKKDGNSSINLQALERDRRANDPRTQEHKIFQQNESSISAWNNVKFDDIDEADLALDKMNSGQSHRLRLMAEFGHRRNNASARGGHTQRGGRGGSTLRGRGNYSNFSRMQDQSVPKGEKRNVEETVARLRGMHDENKTSNENKDSCVVPVHGSHALSTTPAPQPKANLSYRDQRSVYALPISSNSYDVSSTVKKDKQQKSEVQQLGWAAGNLYSLASPEEFLAQSWKTPSKTPCDDSQKTKLPELPSNRSLNHNAVVKASAPENSDKLETQSLQISVEQPVTNNSEIRQQAAVKVEVRCQIEETISSDDGNVQLIKVSNQEQDSLVIVMTVDGKPALQCHAASIFGLVGDKFTLIFDSADSGIYKKWRLTFQLPGIAAQFLDDLQRYTLKPAEFGEVGTLISLSDESELPAEAFSRFTEDLLSLMDDDAVDKMLEAIKRDASKPLLAQVTQIIESAQGETPIPSTSQQLIGLNSSEQQNTDSGEASGNERLRLLGRYGGLASSVFATATEEVVRGFQSKSSAFQSLPSNVSRDYTRGLSRRLINRAQNLAQANTKELSSSPMNAQSTSGLNAVNDNPQKPVNTRITYSIEELMKYRSGACIVKKNLLAEWIPTSSKTSAQGTTNSASIGNNTIAEAEVKKVKYLADSIYADKKQSVSIAPGARNYVPRENASSSQQYAADVHHKAGITSMGKSPYPLKDGSSSLQSVARTKQAADSTSTEREAYRLKNGLLSSRYGTTPGPSSSSVRSLATGSFIRNGKAVSAALDLGSLPASNVQTSLAKLVSHEPSTLAASSLDKAKPKSPLNPICEDFFPSKNNLADPNASARNINSAAVGLSNTLVPVSHGLSHSIAISGNYLMSVSPDFPTGSVYSSPVGNISVQEAPRYETVLIPDLFNPGHYQEIRGIVKASLQQQPLPDDLDPGMY